MINTKKYVVTSDFSEWFRTEGESKSRWCQSLDIFHVSISAPTAGLFRKNNGELYSLEYAEIPKAFFTPSSRTQDLIST